MEFYLVFLNTQLVSNSVMVLGSQTYSEVQRLAIMSSMRKKLQLIADDKQRRYILSMSGVNPVYTLADATSFTEGLKKLLRQLLCL
jgi:hypothetical protein